MHGGEFVFLVVDLVDVMVVKVVIGCSVGGVTYVS